MSVFPVVMNPELYGFKRNKRQGLSKIGLLTALAQNNVVEYLNNNLKSKADHEFLRELARDIGSDKNVAGNYKVGLSAIDNFLFGNQGPYYGQHIERQPGGYYLHGPLDFTQQDVIPPPNMLDMYLGYEPISMSAYSASKVPQNFNWAGGQNNVQPVVYDMTPYSRFRGFRGSGEELDDFWNKVDSLDIGGVLEIPNNIRADWYSSIDLGTFKPVIGKDKSGPYISVSDIWDFGGGGSGTRGGQIMDMIETKNPINLYSRHSIHPDQDLRYSRSIKEMQDDIPWMKAVNAILPEEE